MKTKTETVHRNQARDFDIAMLDCKSEFGDVYSDDILDEIAFIDLLEDED